MVSLFRYSVRKGSLIKRFLVAAAVTIFASMAVLTYAVSHRFESIAMQAAAEEGALLIGNFLGPEVQELATTRSLSEETTQNLDARLRGKLGERVKAIKIWLSDGTLVYASNKKLVGEKFPSAHLAAAFAGRASGSFDDLDDHGTTFERPPGNPLIEIYAPFYRIGTNDVIAVGEIYNDGGRLAENLNRVRLTTASIVGAVTAPMMFILFLMVRRADSIVAKNRASLSRKVLEARDLAAQNNQLRQEADEARLDAIQSNERLLGQIGQDLHDGPIQMLSVLMLKLNDIPVKKVVANVGAPSTAVQSIGDVAARALSELRDVSIGLVLPQLEGLTAKETLLLAVRQHENLTGSEVRHEIDDLGFYPSSSLRICMFRIVQEGLNNAYYYAGGRGQHVAAHLLGNSILITVSDSGVGEGGARSPSARKTGLGLQGLQRRVKGHRGTIDIVRSSTGTLLRVALPTDGTS